MSEIEQELVKLTKVDPAKYKNRQDLLAAFVRGIDKLHEDDFDSLSQPAFEWHRDAVQAMDKKRTIEDFEDVGEEDESEDEESTTDAVSEIEEGSQEENVEVQDSGSAESSSVEESMPEKAPKKAPKKAKAKPKADETERYEKITGEKDRFGITAGSKTSDAVKLYCRPEGATLKQVEEAIGGRHYNILGKLEKAGHKVEKLEKGVWKVTHKDDVS